MVVYVDPKKTVGYKNCLTPKLTHGADIKNPTNDEKRFYPGVTETLDNHVSITTHGVGHAPNT